MHSPLVTLRRGMIGVGISVLFLAQTRCAPATSSASQFSPSTQSTIPTYTPAYNNNNTIDTTTGTYCEVSGTNACANPSSISAVGGQGFASMGGCLQFMVSTQPDPAMTPSDLNHVFSGGAMFLTQCFVNIGQAERILTSPAIAAAQNCLKQVSSIAPIGSNWATMGNGLAGCLQSVLVGGASLIAPPNLGSVGWER